MTKSIFFQRLSATIQFILGFFLGITLIAGVSGAFVFAYYKRMSVLPKKPVFAEVASQPSPSDTTKVESSDILAEPQADSAELATKSELEAEPEPELPPNAYQAEVTWPQGLSLRAEPSLDAEKIGGIEFEQKIIILEDSADGQWQRVRVPESEQEAWVKGGNTKRI